MTSGGKSETEHGALPLDRVQAWMQAVITHPEGVLPGIASAEAVEQLGISADGVEQVITRSRALSSVDRLEIYARAYYGRLLECLRTEYPVLVQAIGEELFDEFAFSYLQHHPSRSYTLNQLGAEFAQFLRETCPASDDPAAVEQGWPLFLMDLATLEWTFNEVFDGPGIEKAAPLNAERLKEIPLDRWPAARFEAAPCLRLGVFDYPVHTYYKALREDSAAPPPELRTTYLAISRREYLVRYLELSRSEYALLKALVEGATLGEGFQSWADSSSNEEPNGDAGMDPAMQVQHWFRRWIAESFFLSVNAG